MNIIVKRFLLALITLMAGVRGGVALAETSSDQSFAPDLKIQKIAEAYSLDAVDFSAKEFGIKLDWSDASIANVEKALEQMSSSYASKSPKPTDEQVMSFAKAYGSYVGEVYRRNLSTGLLKWAIRAGANAWQSTCYFKHTPALFYII
jgi:hypothetical protein